MANMQPDSFLKKNSVPFKSNFYLALVRYRALMQSLNRYPDRLQTYNEALKKLFDNGEKERVIENPQESKKQIKTVPTDQQGN